jgi:Circularly permutated YpsA SLOG family
LITIVHGGQTGVDRGAHEAAIDNDWPVAGYMPRDGRDECGKIPDDVAKFLVPHEKTSYAARTEANVHAVTAALIVVHDADDPRVTPGTTKTLELAKKRRLRRLIVDPRAEPTTIARWIWSDLLMMQAQLPLLGQALAPLTTRLLVAGPRESKWQGARVQTAALLRRVAIALAEISRPRAVQ